MITKEQFGLWKQNPATKWFFEFLQAKQDFLKSSALEQWIDGKPWPETVRGQIIELDEAIHIDRAAILAFYGIEEIEEDGVKPESHSR